MLHMRALFAAVARSWVVLMAATQLSCMTFHRGPLPGAPDDATYLEAQGTRVRYVDVGQGSPVVLLHGFASSLDTWDRVIPELSSAHRVIALDLRGFGWTDRPEGDYSPTAQAELVLAVMDQLGVQKAAVVGHSWGASVALSVALLAPARVTRLVLYDAWAYEAQLPSFFVWSRAPGLGETLFRLFYTEQAEERLAHAFYDKRHVTPELVDAVVRAMERPGTIAAALAAVRGQRYSTLEPRYRDIGQPTLLLWGREDRVSPPLVGERLLRDLRQASLHVYPRCGHFPMIEAFVESTAELRRFLGEDAAQVSVR